MKKELGKISNISVGFGGYQNAQFGVSFTLEGREGWGVGDFWGAWGIERSEYAKWTEEERIDSLGKTMWRIRNLLRDAKVMSVTQLKGIPIEVTFEGDKLKSWRILKEVL